MDELKFQQVLAELRSFRQHLSGSNVEERDVSDYHRLLESLGKETGLSNFRDFCVPDDRLEYVNTVAHIGPVAYNRFNRSPRTQRSERRYCDYDFFLRKLDGAIIFIECLLVQQTKQPIGF